METTSPFVSILRAPDLIRAFGPGGEVNVDAARPQQWSGPGFEIETIVEAGAVSVRLRGGSNVSRIQLRWRGDMRAVCRLLGDHWERSYGDLEWRGVVPGRTMPWYFMAHDGTRTHGYGVRTGASAMCFWNCDAEGISLWADVRSGGSPVELGERELAVADVLCREGRGAEGAFQATQEFCRQMCLAPRLPEQPVYGTNDWNYAYGNNSAGMIADVSELISELSPNSENRPFSVIDEGWAEGPFNGKFGYGPWFGNPRFGDMDAFAARLKGIGVRPGIWFRPLTPLPGMPEAWKLERSTEFLDPTVPEVHEHVASHIRRLVSWGYELIKHDFTSWDLFGRWGMQMGPSTTDDGWRLHNPAITNAEALTRLYATIRDAAGDAYLIGCNTVGHLAAGYHEIQRTGDDTSGRSWNRNRRMGVNTLAFRAPQHNAFFAADPDIVALTRAVPWELVEQWLRLVSESGTALFVAIEPGFLEPHHRTALQKALQLASMPQTIGEPLDWMDTDCPRIWNLLGKKVEFHWMGNSGAWPFGD